MSRGNNILGPGKTILLFIVSVLLIGMNSCSQATNAGEESGKDGGAVNFLLEPFTLNIAGHGETKFVRISLALELANASLSEIAKAKTAPLRDAIIALVTSRSPEDFLGQDGKIQLKDEILLQANQILKEGAVKNVYFTDIVMQ